MTTLVAIPCVTGPGHVRPCVTAFHAEADVCLIDNGAELAVQGILRFFGGPHIENPRNVYVNAAWNQAIRYFLDQRYETLVIANSDLIMGRDWKRTLEIAMADPRVSPTVRTAQPPECFACDPRAAMRKPVEHAMGIFIVLRRQWAEWVYPIPDCVKIWFGDEWIYSILRARGIETVVPGGLVGFHTHSRTIAAVPEAAELIEQDKIAWELRGRQLLAERIASL